ncbi:hypothetical protein POSPLADRAFT_1056499 [Postia placenta MAD-698-R-SB12]|uniref:Uncharacterized protein n=1 Tax=Postia placenta MAD-698-R-SB12 TaxID=670580 RepID=A0A1X6N3T5_9APHY|nr:hypothetical protein POSPLADRAFT_1056499 [Postia placenta MAD-698-R-SB12]OSX63136.1 hypothetical protein POSPLADRAFT_1056499 [Postia placenta MAD-698-R-SB12]
MENSGGARDRARMEGRTHGEAAQEGEVQKHAIEENEDSDRVYAPICTSLCRRYTVTLGCYGSGWLREDEEAAKDGSRESWSDLGAARLVIEGVASPSFVAVERGEEESQAESARVGGRQGSHGSAPAPPPFRSHLRSPTPDSHLMCDLPPPQLTSYTRQPITVSHLKRRSARLLRPPMATVVQSWACIPVRLAAYPGVVRHTPVLSHTLPPFRVNSPAWSASSQMTHIAAKRLARILSSTHHPCPIRATPTHPPTAQSRDARAQRWLCEEAVCCGSPFTMVDAPHAESALYHTARLWFRVWAFGWTQGMLADDLQHFCLLPIGHILLTELSHNLRHTPARKISFGSISQPPRK